MIDPPREVEANDIISLSDRLVLFLPRIRTTNVISRFFGDLLNPIGNCTCAAIIPQVNRQDTPHINQPHCNHFCKLFYSSKRSTSMIKNHRILSRNLARKIRKTRTVIYGGQQNSLAEFLQKAASTTPREIMLLECFPATIPAKLKKQLKKWQYGRKPK